MQKWGAPGLDLGMFFFSNLYKVKHIFYHLASYPVIQVCAYLHKIMELECHLVRFCRKRCIQVFFCLTEVIFIWTVY